MIPLFKTWQSYYGLSEVICLFLFMDAHECIIKGQSMFIYSSLDECLHGFFLLCISRTPPPTAECLGWPFEGKLWLRVALILIKRGFSMRQSRQRNDIRARRLPRKITGYRVVTLALLTQVRFPSGYCQRSRVWADNVYGISAIGPVIKIKKSGGNARLIRA